MSVTVIADPRVLEHDPGDGHPECPARYAAAASAFDRGLLDVVRRPARKATFDEIRRVHSAAYADRLERLIGVAEVLDPDTRTSAGSMDAALVAAGSTIDLAISIARKETPPGIAIVRPPGHHATPLQAMGFCLINNVAVAARALIASGLAERVAIYDFDVHHGNGTQDSFYEDPNVLYMSTHQWPFYPGTGDVEDVGIGAGRGTTINIPLPGGTDDDLIFEACDRVLLPALDKFRPDVILLSAGFDGYVNDPVGGFRLTTAAYEGIGTRFTDAAARLCDGKVAAVLEGGYDLEGLGDCVLSFAKTLDS